MGRKKLTTDEFVERARKAHGDKFDYSEVRYVNAHTKCDIVCKTHGVFQQGPHNHLAGNGCPACVGNVKSTTAEFIEKAKNLHGDRFDYAKVRYVNAHTKCDIVCRTHGVFQQAPHNHLRGKGCPRCNESKGEKQVSELLAKYDLTFDPQKTFEGLRHKKPLKCDFYVPEINTVIEYQGEHHYGIGRNADRDKHNTIPIRDQIKRDFFREKGIHLIEIPYWEDTETYLRDALLPILRLRQRV